MRKILTFFILIPLFSFMTSAQNIKTYEVILSPDKGEKVKISLSPFYGMYAEKVEDLPLTITWLEESDKISFKFEGTNSFTKGQQIWFPLQKEKLKSFRKSNKDVWYAKNIKKYMEINSFWRETDDRLKLSTESNKPLRLNLNGSSVQDIQFEITDTSNKEFEITLNIYFAVEKRKSGFSKKPDTRFEFLSRSLVKIILKPYQPCEDIEFINIMSSLDHNTELLGKLSHEIDSLIKINDCEKVKEKKEDSKQYVIEENSNKKYDNCEDFDSAIKRNNQIVEEINSKTCVKIKTAQNIPVVKCTHSSQKTKQIIEEANKDLMELRKQIQQLKIKGETVGNLSDELDKIKKKVESSYCEKCIKQNQDVYNTYLAWCKNISELLK